MKKVYEKPRIIPRTDRHLWPKEALILDSFLTGSMSMEDAIQKLEDAGALYAAGLSGSTFSIKRPTFTKNGKHPTSDEQELVLYRRELLARYNSRKA